MKAIINATNSSLLDGGGVDAAISVKEPIFLKKCRIFQECDIGKAEIIVELIQEAEAMENRNY